MVRITNPASLLIPKLQGLHLFHYDGATCAQRVRFALHEKGLVRGREVKFDAADASACKGQDGAWVSRQVSLIKKDHMTPAYAAIHSNLVVPALVHNGELHVESMEIVAYLDDAFGGTPLVPTHNPQQLEDAAALTQLGKELHRSIRFVTFRWGLRGLARLSGKEEANLKDLLIGQPDGEALLEFYQGYDQQSIPEDVYLNHLKRLNGAFADHEQRLADGRKFLVGDDLSMADVIWAMKTLRLTECDYPFQQCFPRYHEWYQRIYNRPSFQQGVMGKHKLMSGAFRAKAKVEHLMGIGLKREVLKLVT